MYDTDGNRTAAEVSIVPNSTPNRAPQPFFHVTRSKPLAGEPVLFDARQTSDPDHSSTSLLVEWDFDGDGIFDTSPATTKTATTQLASPGNHLARFRVTDPAGAQSISSPIALHVRSTTTEVGETNVTGRALSASILPNPFRSGAGAAIRFDIPASAQVSLDVFDVQGHLVRALVAGKAMTAGSHYVTWSGLDSNGRRAGAGVYFLRLSSGRLVATRRLVLVR